MEQVRLAELCATISLFTDLGTGQSGEHALRTTLTAMRLADDLGIEQEARAGLYYASLLRFFGCTADAAATAAAVGGDEAAFYAAMAPVSMGSGREQIRTMSKVVAADAPRATRLRRLATMLSDRRGAERTLLPHCEVGARLAERMDLPGGVASALRAAYARWDGNGVPAGLSGEDIPRSMRIAIVARDIVLWSERADSEVADVLSARRGRALDPTVVDTALDDMAALIVPTDGDLWARTIDAEPPPHRMLAGPTLEAALVALADFADLKTPQSGGHSRGVAALVGRAAQLCGVPPEEIDLLRRAGFVHDLGRVGVSNTIWCDPGRLSTAQWERIRLHPYYSERILARTTGLGDMARLSGSHHERADGSGYHRGTNGDLGTAASLLAAADACQAMGQPRPHRAPLSAEEIATELRGDVRVGRLPRAAVDAVLAATRGATTPLETRRPGGLTEREVDVLRLIARGLTNRQTAGALGISPKTVGTHVEHIYSKAAVTTRAGATLFAIEHELLDPS